MNFLRFICEASYDAMIASMKQKYPDYAQVIDWAKPNLKKQDRVVWYLNTIRSYLESNRQNAIETLQQNLIHYLGQPIPQIQNFVFAKQPAQEVFNQFAALEQQWQAKQNQSKPPPIQQGDQKIIEFADGSAWWRLNRAYCPDEARSGRHCGNAEGQTRTDQRILSYRSKSGHVILTFILEPNGTLGEMKAIANQKPDAKYHPAIIQLLMNPAIKGISGQGYFAEQNFNIFDLSPEQQLYVYQQKPNLVADQVKITPFDLLRATPEIQSQTNLQAIVLEKYPKLQSLFEKNNIENWEKVLITHPETILFAPPEVSNYRKRILKHITQKNSDLLRAPQILRNDFDFLSDFIKNSKEEQALLYIPTNVRGYDKLCLQAVRQNGDALQYVPENLRTPELCFEAVRQYGYELRFVPQELRTPELCLAAVRQYGDALEYVPENLKTFEICLAAVRQYGTALEYVPENLQPKIQELLDKERSQPKESMDRLKHLAGIKI